LGFCSGALYWSLLAAAQETKIERSQLPPPVESAVASLAKTATARGFSREIEHGVTYYEAEMMVAGHHRDYLMDGEGNVVEVEEDVVLESVPVSIQDALQAMARDGKVQSVESITKNGKLAAYEAQIVRNGRQSKVKMSPEGEPLNQEQ
jgi:ATP-dependent protease HslVU (ClpYQ) peptidase subunit